VKAQVETNNDECDGALDVSSLLPYVSVDNNAGAFPAFSDLTCEVESDTRGLWYQYTPTDDTVAVAAVSDQTFAAMLSIYTGTCGSLTCLGTTTALQFTNRALTWAASAATTYYILVSGGTSGDAGNFQIRIEVRLLSRILCIKSMILRLSHVLLQLGFLGVS